MIPPRKTFIAHGRFAALSLRKQLAEQGAWGTSVMSFEQAAARLAGGFLRPIDQDSLRHAIQEVLPSTDLGELEQIKLLPGMVGAVAGTLRKAWRGGLDLQERGASHKRIAAVAALERAVLEALPAGMMRPGDLVREALRRIDHAPAIFGAIEISGITELSPCWRELRRELAMRVPITWRAGSRYIPNWIAGSRVAVETNEPSAPAISAISAASALHEVVEALRWARDLMASGRAKPSEIAIAAASPSDYDDHFLALRADANLDLKFVHGTSALATRDGQAAAALADILINGLSQMRLRRLAALAKDFGPLDKLPENWTHVLGDAPLNRPEAWDRFFARVKAENWPDGLDHVPHLRAIVRRLSRGMEAAEEAGALFLRGRAWALWKKALESGPPAAIELTLAQLRIDDCVEAPNAIVWGPAAAIAACPRPYVRLLGLTSRAWPRLGSEDPLLPSHVIAVDELDPLPIATADRRDFATILATTSKEVVLSRARQDGEGRLLGKSPLLHQVKAEETYLRRNRTPAHAMSESDRLTGRRAEFAQLPLARSASAAWADWFKREITAHDGLMRGNHPLVLQVLAREHSATSLRKLLRDPLAFIWRYALSLKTLPVTEEPLTLEPLEFGNLFHQVLQVVVRRLEAGCGVAKATETELREAIAASIAETAAEIEAEQAVPPFVVWRRALDEVDRLARVAVRPADQNLLTGQISFAEVPFGQSEGDATARNLPWDPSRPVEIPGVGLRIRGFIDRLDLSDDLLRARVTDYKTGKAPEKGPFVLNGGRELQRCLYSFATKALLGENTEVEAALRYVRADLVLPLEGSDRVLERVSSSLAGAKRSVEGGRIAPGPDAADQYNDLRFALPASAANSYWTRKEAPARALLGDASSIWDAE